MNVVILVVSLVLLLIAVVLFLKRPGAVDGISADEFARLKNEADQLKIALARAEEKSIGLVGERDKADKQLQDERLRYDAAISTLNHELLTEKNRMAKAEESFVAQRQRLNRCDQMRRTTQRSSRLKSFRTWARL